MALVAMLAVGLDEAGDVAGMILQSDVLRAVAERIQAQVRTGDVVARFGIDEFGVVMRHGGRDDAQVLARRIVRAVASPITLSSGDTVGVGISVGMAAYDDDIESVRTLLAQRLRNEHIAVRETLGDRLFRPRE